MERCPTLVANHRQGMSTIDTNTRCSAVRTTMRAGSHRLVAQPQQRRNRHQQQPRFTTAFLLPYGMETSAVPLLSTITDSNPNQQLPTCCPSIVGVSLRTKPQAGIHRGNNSTQQVVRNECEIHRRMIPLSIVAATNIQCTDEAEQRNAHRGRTTTLNQPNKRYEQRMSESCSQQPLHSR